MNFFFNRGKKRVIPRDLTFRLTQEGREKLQDYKGDDKSRVLMTLETEGSCDIEELSRASGVSKGRLEKLIPHLIRNGYIAPVGGVPSGVD